jgi:AAA15 family ATPase/GTPase
MKISEIKIENFKRFTDLTINKIPEKARIIIIVGPNGCGKSSLLDAFHSWYRNKIEPYTGRDAQYYPKDIDQSFDYEKNVSLKFHDFVLLDNTENERNKVKGKFYFRTAYRNQADFTISSISKLEDPTKTGKMTNLIQNDATVSENYQRLVSLTIQNIYDENNGEIKVRDLRENLIGKIRVSLKNIFPDLNLTSIGDPLQNGTFFFEKGNVKNFHYKNLSGGEKAAFDIILDLIIKTSYFKDAIYCIDEPETHMHTQLQSTLFEEIYKLVPANSQLWINTHSLGILKKAKQLASISDSEIAFISFDNVNFDLPTTLSPSNIDKQIWEKSINLALDDFSNLLAPEKVILCEGDSAGRKIKNFDADIYNRVFNFNYPDVIFSSIGSSNDLEKDDSIAFLTIKNILKNSSIIRLIDGDDKSDSEIEELNLKGIKVLKRRHIESYLWDDEIISKICDFYNQPEKTQDIIDLKNEKMNSSNTRGNSKDDIKSASSEIYAGIKKILNLTKTGSSKEIFLRDIVSSLITIDTNVYTELEKNIFR